MNNTFSIQRFINYEKRNFCNEWIHYVIIALIPIVFYLLTVVDYIDNEREYYLGIIDNMNMFFGLIILISPLVLENLKRKNARIQEFLMPVSNTERFIHLAFKYFIYIPVVIVIVFSSLYLFSEQMGYNEPSIDWNGIPITKPTFYQLLSRAFINFPIIGAAIFLFGSYYFKKYLLPFTFIATALLIASIIYLGAFYLKTFYEGGSFELFDIFSYLNPVKEAEGSLVQIPPVLYYCQIFISYILPLGILTATYFKIREYET